MEKLIGTRLTEHLSSDAMHTLRGKLSGLGASNESGRMFDVDLGNDGRRFDVAMHRLGQSYIMEVERKTTEANRDDMAAVDPLFARARSTSSIEKMCEVAATGLQVLSGFGRVMVYRFEPDESGAVIAEACRPDMDSYRGLHFPASDIPAQARALYTRSLLRIIPDVDAPTAPSFLSMASRESRLICPLRSLAPSRPCIWSTSGTWRCAPACPSRSCGTGACGG